MRRLVCVAGLLLGLSGDRYVWSAKWRSPVPAVQPIELRDTDGTERSIAWWLP